MSKAQRDIRRKRQVLEHAARIGNIRKTCRHFGILRFLFYVWRGKYERDGEAGCPTRSVTSHRKLDRNPCGTAAMPSSLISWLSVASESGLVRGLGNMGDHVGDQASIRQT